MPPQGGIIDRVCTRSCSCGHLSHWWSNHARFLALVLQHTQDGQAQNRGSASSQPARFLQTCAVKNNQCQNCTRSRWRFITPPFLHLCLSRYATIESGSRIKSCTSAENDLYWNAVPRYRGVNRLYSKRLTRISGHLSGESDASAAKDQFRYCRTNRVTCGHAMLLHDDVVA